MTLKVALLGPPVIECDGRPLEVDTRKAVAILAYLVVTGRGHGRDELAGMLWPEYEQARARAALRRTLSTLNKGLGGRWLDTGRERIALDRTALWSDVGESEALLAETEDHGHPPTEGCARCVGPLTRAAELHRGDFMAGFSLRDSAEFDDWQVFQAERARRELGTVLLRLTAGLAATGATGQAVEHARRWLHMDALNEPAHRRLMVLYAQSGDRAAALRQYRECVDILDRELGVPPLPETTEAYEAIRDDRLPAPAPPSAAPAQPRLPAVPLVGRSADLERLVAAHAAVGRDGRLLVIEGEAGIGKTRLAEELAARLGGRGASVLSVRCYEDESSLAYGPVVPLLEAAADVPAVAEVPPAWRAEAARLVPELAPSDGPGPAATEGPGAQTRFVRGVARVIEAALSGDVPGVAIVDDVQWADEASLDVLVHLLQRIRGHALCVVMCWRTEGMPADHRVRRLAGRLQTEGLAEVVHLGRLDPDEVDELVRRSWPEDRPPDGLAARLYQETEGLPFFCVTYLAQLAGQPSGGDWALPGGVRELVGARLARLSETARQVVTTAAVIGRSFDLDTLVRASGRSEEETVAAMEELVGSGLVVEHPGGSGYDFAHEKIRSLAYERSGLARRRLLHRRVAEALTAAARGPGERGRLAGLVANHYVLSGRSEEAALRYAEAGHHARGVLANSEALEHFQSALAMGHPEPGAIREAIGDLRTLRGEYREALDAYEAAAAVADSMGDLARIEHKLGAVHLRRGEWETADAHLRAAADACTGDGDTGLRARIAADRSLAASRRGLEDEAGTLAQEALELAGAAGAEAALAQARNILGMLGRRRGDLATARHHLERSLELAERLDDPTARIAALNNLALAESSDGATDRALELLRTALGVCAMQGDRHREAAIHNNLADVLRAAGRTEDAMSHLKQAVAIFAEIGEHDRAQPEIWKLVDW